MNVRENNLFRRLTAAWRAARRDVEMQSSFREVIIDLGRMVGSPVSVQIAVLDSDAWPLYVRGVLGRPTVAHDGTWMFSLGSEDVAGLELSEAAFTEASSQVSDVRARFGAVELRVTQGG